MTIVIKKHSIIYSPDCKVYYDVDKNAVAIHNFTAPLKISEDKFKVLPTTPQDLLESKDVVLSDLLFSQDRVFHNNGQGMYLGLHGSFVVKKNINADDVYILSNDGSSGVPIILE